MIKIIIDNEELVKNSIIIDNQGSNNLAPSSSADGWFVCELVHKRFKNMHPNSHIHVPTSCTTTQIRVNLSR